jgi:Zn ribbon nucleic-acid-binding protein
VLKAAILLVGLVTSSVIWAWKRADARKRLREIDAGARCVSCEALEMQRLDHDRVRCLVCGHVASVAALGATKLSAAEIDAATRPDTQD